MRKKMVNSLFIFLIILMCSTVAFATHIPTNIPPSLNGYDDGRIGQMAANIIGALMWIGYAIAIGMIVFIGIKYIMASADEKASMKGALIKVVVGGIIIATSVTITNIVLTIAK